MSIAASRAVPRLLLAILVVLLAAAAPFAQPRTASAQDATTSESASDWAAPRTVYVPETGQTVDGLFLDLWRDNGTTSFLGNPVTPEITRADGSIVQYYQYARFEYWPNGDSNGDMVTLGQVGEDLRPMAMTRLAVGGATGKSAQLNRVALAWAPLNPAQIQPDSDTYLYVEETGHSIYDGFLAYWRDTGLGEYLGNPVSEEYILDGVSYQVFERGQLRWAPGDEVSMVPVGEKLADQQRLSRDPVGQGDLPVFDEALFIPPPPPAPAPEEVVPAPAVAAAAVEPSGERWIDVNLSSQYMVAYQGSSVIVETYISSGRWSFETPTGTFYTNSKFPIQEMVGTNNGESWLVPDVPNVMYFTGKGHAFHGTYWHDNFGTPMSHGCINLPMWVSEVLYEWAPIGTRVEIHY